MKFKVRGAWLIIYHSRLNRDILSQKKKHKLGNKKKTNLKKFHLSNITEFSKNKALNKNGANKNKTAITILLTNRWSCKDLLTQYGYKNTQRKKEQESPFIHFPLRVSLLFL